MPMRPLPMVRFRPGLSLILLTVLMLALWIAGGASRADVFAQPLIRSVATIVLFIAILFGKRLSLRDWGVPGALLAAALVLALLQLVPLPPAWWQALPGRAVFMEAAAASGQAQPWRSWSIVPEATVNAAGSLIVPITMLVVLHGLNDEEKRWLPAMVLVFVASAMLLGLVQFSGMAIENPFFNDTPGEVSAVFANRNHFALLLAIGCLIAPVWAFGGGQRAPWRVLAALGCVLLFILMILATGSRAGILVGVIALCLGTLLIWRETVRLFRGAPRWLLPTVVAAIVGIVAVLGWISFAADRAVSIQRALVVGTETDIRSRTAGTVISMVKAYFPTGTGLGSFDPVFRLHEPDNLLKPTYFNHAHDDFIEIVLDAGLPGMLLLLAALAWWVYASVRAWRGKDHRQQLLPRLGSATLGLVILASLFDYPARTPIIMALIVLAATWLRDAAGGRHRLYPTSTSIYSDPALSRSEASRPHA